MTSQWIRRVQFLLQEQTQAEVSRQTGMPSSTISYVARGLREVPAQYEADLRNFYQREAYSRLREASFSVTQANRFKSYAPERVTQWIAKYDDTVLKFSEGVAGARIEKYVQENGSISADMRKTIFNESLVDVEYGVSHSKFSSEDITSDWY